MAEAGAGADIVHPKDERMAQSVSTLRTALGTDGYTNAELSSMTKNDMVYADDLNVGRAPEGDRQDLGSPPYNVCTGATAGDPGTLTPAGCVRPADKTAMSGVTASPATLWTVGQHVLIYDDEKVYWDSNSWEDGEAPA